MYKFQKAVAVACNCSPGYYFAFVPRKKSVQMHPFIPGNCEVANENPVELCS